MSDQQLPVVVIGSGPVGLAAAAHLIDRGLEPLVLEAGVEVATGVAGWGHVPLFSPWRFSIDAVARHMLEAHGWSEPEGDEHPTGAELRERYLLPLAATPALVDRVRTGHRVVAVTRRATDKMKDADRERAPFELVVATAGGLRRLLGRAVIDASGTVAAHNPLGSAGVPALGEHEAADRIDYGIPDVVADVERYASKRVLVVGSGHSAMSELQSLATIKDTYPATEIHWAVRRGAGDERVAGRKCDRLPARLAHSRAVRALVERGDITLHRDVRVEAIQQASRASSLRSAGGVFGNRAIQGMPSRRRFPRALGDPVDRPARNARQRRHRLFDPLAFGHEQGPDQVRRRQHRLGDAAPGSRRRERVRRRRGGRKGPGGQSQGV